ncbi:MAG: 5-formyltetrahydrofolate cyclo-ligase [Oleispira sp.]|nr:5-formyltetrahydrofolate cyclo-ligase [Oleispira sp.]
MSADTQLSVSQQKRLLRTQVRETRRSLSAPAQKRAAIRLQHQLSKNPSFKYAKRIALYLPSDGEVDTKLAIKQAWKRGQSVYLPVLDPIRKGFLWFVEYKANSIMRNNRFGIAEPHTRFNKRISAKFIQAVGLPLVAFDNQGNRLGMGGGFYDRSFEFCQQAATKPKLFGLAHKCQQVDKLPTESWDIQLAGIIEN